MKKITAMTLSEVMITLTIIGVVAAITIPTIKARSVNKDAVMFRKAILNTSSALDKAAVETNEYSYYNSWAALNAANLTGVNFCTAAGSAISTAGTPKCTAAELGSSDSSYDNYNYQTLDGLRYWGFETAFDASGNKIVYVDRILNSDEKSDITSKKKRAARNGALGLQLQVDKYGTVSIPSSASYELSLIEKGTKVTND